MSKIKKQVNLINQSNALASKYEKIQQCNESKESQKLKTMSSLALSFLRTKQVELSKNNLRHNKTMRNKQKVMKTQKSELNDFIYPMHLSSSVIKPQRTDPSPYKISNQKKRNASSQKRSSVKPSNFMNQNVKQRQVKPYQTLNRSKQCLLSHDRKIIKTNESCERSKNIQQKKIKNLKQFILDEHIKNPRTQKSPQEVKRQQGILSNLKRRVQKSKISEPRSFAFENQKNEVSGVSGKKKKIEKLDDILSSAIQIKNANDFKNVKLLNQEQNSIIKESQIQKEKDIILCTTNKNENQIQINQNDIQIQRNESDGEKQLKDLIQNYEKSIDKFIKNQNKDLIQEDEGINIQYIEKVLDFFDSLANKDEKFHNIFQKIQVSVGLMVHKAIEQIIELRQVVMDLSKQVDTLEQMKLQKIQQEKQQSQKLEKYQEYILKFITPDSNQLDTFKIVEENQRLRLLLTKQKKNFCEMMEKEQKVMKLLYAIRQSGVDIETIYKSCMTPEASTSNNSKDESRKVGIQSNQELEKEIKRTQNINQNCGNFKKQKDNNIAEPQQQKQYKDLQQSESEDSDFLFYQYEDDKEQQQNSNANTQMKLNLQSVQNANQLGFHEEFMANMNEWSESWRQAAEKEKKF